MSIEASHDFPSGSLLSFAGASTSSILMTDALAADNPIVYVNPAFEQMTGYASREILGRNCRFLQQDDREQEARALIRAAIGKGHSCECLLRNYRRSGEMFWNKLYLFPLRMGGADITHFVGVQHDVTLERRLLAELEQTASERARLIEQLEVKRRHMARLSRDLINAQESERKSLARELHDELGQRTANRGQVLQGRRAGGSSRCVDRYAAPAPATR